MTRTTTGGRALVVGMGISGIAAAQRLRDVGWEPVILERAAGRRGGGYFVALFGAGKSSAERLGILERIPDRTVGPTSRTYEVDRSGNRSPGMGFEKQPGMPWTMLRGDVENAAFSTLSPDIEIRYSTTPLAIRQNGDEVVVTMRNTATGAENTERFDLVVGADGIRSTVRRLVFGPDKQYLHRLNYIIGACELPSNPPGLAPGDGMTLAEPGRSARLFPFRDHLPTALFSYRTENVDAEFSRPAIDSLRTVFGPKPTGEFLGWMLDEFEAAPDHLFDSVEQVRMDSWHRGRVVLVGDSAWCVNLYSGMGVSAGLAGAELLGTKLQLHPDDLPRALAQWERQLQPYIAYHQERGIKQRMAFTPANRRERMLRSARLRIAARPLGRRLVARQLTSGKLYDMKELDVAAIA